MNRIPGTVFHSPPQRIQHAGTRRNQGTALHRQRRSLPPLSVCDLVCVVCVCDLFLFTAGMRMTFVSQVSESESLLRAAVCYLRACVCGCVVGYILSYELVHMYPGQHKHRTEHIWFSQQALLCAPTHSSTFLHQAGVGSDGIKGRHSIRRGTVWRLLVVCDVCVCDLFLFLHQAGMDHDPTCSP